MSRRNRYRVFTYVTATAYCYVLARSAAEAVELAFEAYRVRPHTQSPAECDAENNVWYTPKIDGIPVNDGSVEADLVARPRRRSDSQRGAQGRHHSRDRAARRRDRA